MENRRNRRIAILAAAILVSSYVILGTVVFGLLIPIPATGLLIIRTILAFGATLTVYFALIRRDMPYSITFDGAGLEAVYLRGRRRFEASNIESCEIVLDPLGAAVRFNSRHATVGGLSGLDEEIVLRIAEHMRSLGVSVKRVRYLFRKPK